MRVTGFCRTLLLALALGAGLPAAAQPQVLMRAPDGMQSLDEAWRWAVDETGARGAWIVWQVHSTLDERIAPTVFYGGMYASSHGLSLEAMLAGNTPQQPRTREQDLLVMAELVNGRLVRVRVVTPQTPYSWQRPVYWLGPASSADSFALLHAALDAAANTNLRREVLYAIGLHNHPERNEVLEALYADADSQAFRRAVVASLALQPSPAVEEFLLDVAADERANLPEREEALHALGRQRSDAALPLLREVTAPEHPLALREAAIDALAEFDADQVQALLESLARADAHSDIRESAMESLADLGTRSALELLLELAHTHPSAETRKQAMESLEDSLFD